MNRPSGEQFEIRHGAHRVVVVEVGGGIREWAGVLDGYAEDAMCKSARGQVLAPWPNRLDEGRYQWDGVEHQVPLDEPPQAMHGLVRWRNWSAVARGEDRVELEHVLHPTPGFPFSLRLRVEYRLDSNGLTVHTKAENVGERALPFGVGHHPYIARHADEVFAPGETHDDARPFTGEIAIADVTVWGDEHWRWLQLYTGDERPDVARRCVGVEPMTCRRDALRTGEDVIRLEPGDVWDGRWGIAP
ncbi:MAG: aldose 1-epimerase family protein [Gaiellaceae bacterium]